MKKYFIILLFLLLGVGQVYASVAPAGQKEVPVCAYFTNTEAMLNSIAVIGSETDAEGTPVDISQFISNECFRPSDSSHDYSVFGMSPSNTDVLKSSTYDPRADFAAYRTNIELTMGTMYVPTTSTLNSVKNAYRIVRLDTAKGKLYVETVKTERYYEGLTSPTVVNGKVTQLTDTDTGPKATSDTSTDTTSNTVSQGPKVFTDVPSSNSYYQALKYLKEQEIVGGYADGSFKPNDTINRAEFTKIVVGVVATENELNDCMAHYASQNSYMASVFTDVTFAMVGGNEPVWYFNYVCMAKFKGFVGGYADGTFKPTQKITFAEAAKIISNTLGYEVNASTPWYKSYVQQLDSRNAIPTTIKSFNQNITRGEMAEMIWRLRAFKTNLPSASYSDLK